MNLALRGVIVGVVADALRHPDAPKYAGKAIGTRGLALVAASLVIPALHALSRARRHRERRYPLWTDNLYLSVFALDLAGNVLDLYDRWFYFDLVAHAHGTGAITVVFSEVTDGPALAGVGFAQVAHVGLEAQEYYSDLAFGLRNVRGTWDTVNDLLAGATGSLAYAAAYAKLRGIGWINRRS